ncbi:MAG: hypothetical protein K8E24_000490 [Methanobacterium paludis]|nr:hypothetical protein [Methanobacterium paludis]
MSDYMELLKRAGEFHGDICGFVTSFKAYCPCTDNHSVFNIFSPFPDRSYSVTREIGKTFLKELESSEMDLNGQENALESVRKYFIDQHKFALDMDYEVKEDEVELIVKNCRFFSICKQLESQNILITTCPYTNTAAMALEKVTGYRYRIKKEQKGYGHHITLKKLSQVKNI